MASSPESYAVEREFAESMVDPFEAILELRAQLLDAKRNEERVVGELQSLVLKLESELVGLRVEVAELKAKLKRAIAERNHENTRKLDAVQVARAMRTTMDAATAKLNTLEAAVRAVRDIYLDDLYALVPDGSEGGDS